MKKSQLDKLREKARRTIMGEPGGFRQGKTRKALKEREREFNDLIGQYTPAERELTKMQSRD